MLFLKILDACNGCLQYSCLTTTFSTFVFYLASTRDYGYPISLFFRYPKQVEGFYFRVFLVMYLVKLWYLVHQFELLSHFFCKKLRFSYILEDFLFGFGIQFWAIENLRSSHYASEVRGMHYAYCIEPSFLISNFLQVFYDSLIIFIFFISGLTKWPRCGGAANRKPRQGLQALHQHDPGAGR